MKAIRFDKYRKRGAYHWKECRRNLRNYLEYNPALEARYRIVVESVRTNPGGSLLDVGCGDGYLLSQLAGSIDEGIGIDSEEEAVRVGSQMLGDLQHCSLQMNVCYDLPFEDARFDWVTSTDVIEHLEDPAQHLAEIARVLKPGGRLVLTTPKYRPDRMWDERHVQEFKAEKLRGLLDQYFSEVEMRFFWPRWASRIYETKVGWRIVKFAGIMGLNPFNVVGRSPKRYGQNFASCRKSATSDQTN